MLSRRLFLTVCGLPVISWADDNADWILKLGGQVRRNDTGEVVDVNLRGRWVSAAEILDLLRYQKLVRLNLSLTRIADQDLLLLRPAVQIEELNLAHAEHVTDIGLSVIKDWKNLKRLDVSGTQAANGTLTLLSNHPQLESLDVAGSEVTDDGMQELLPLIHLKHLGLGRTRIDESAISVLGLLDNLQSLDLSATGRRRRRRDGENPVSPSLVEAMAQLRDLRILRLGHSQISSDGVRMLASSLNKLERLGLEECVRVDDSAIAAFIDWKSLRQLDLQGTSVTSSNLDELRKSRPDLRVLASPSRSS
jgi:Leucine-rich repeat (LRR) protein